MCCDPHCYSSFHFSLSFNPTWKVRCPHLFLCIFCSSFYVFDPFFFNFCRIDIFVCVAQERGIAVLIAFCLCAVYFVGFVFVSCWLPPFSFWLLPLVDSSSFFVSSAWFFPSFFLYFRFVCTMRRNILRCVERIKFSCSCESVHVPEAYVNVGVMTVLNKRSLWRRRYDLDVHSCLHLVNDAQAALFRFFISVVSCCSNVIVSPRYFAHSLAGNTSTLMLSIVTSILLYDP